MDFSLLANTSISLLVGYLKTAGFKFYEESIGEVGKKVGGLAWEKGKQLHENVKKKLSTKEDIAKIISDLEKSPENKDIQAALRYFLREAMITDEGFAKELISLLKEASENGADTYFNISINGDVQKLVQIGNVYGDIKI